MRDRSRATAVGLAVVALYVVAAVGGGSLSPLARRPLLDGLAPIVPYRWVDPPPALAESNLPPASGSFVVPLGPEGSRPVVLSTADAQATLIVDTGLFPTSPTAREVAVTIEPLDPAELAASPGILEILGNAYRIEATYRPSGDDVARLAFPANVTLVYPAIPGPVHTQRILLRSTNGTRWARAETTDVPALQQAGAEVASLGYFAIGAPPAASATPDPSSRFGGLPLVLLVVGLSAVLIGAGHFARRRHRAVNTPGRARGSD